MPSSFKTPLIVTALPHRKWRIKRPFEYYTKTQGITKGDVITIPKGFITDFASIPKIFWSIIGSPNGKYTKAAVVHDYCYAKQLYPRKQCDLIFLEGMKVLGVSWWKRKLMYLAVRTFAWIPWNKYKKKNK